LITFLVDYYVDYSKMT